MNEIIFILYTVHVTNVYIYEKYLSLYIVRELFDDTRVIKQVCYYYYYY